MSLLVQIAQLRSDADRYSTVADGWWALVSTHLSRGCTELADAADRKARMADAEAVRLKLEAAEIEQRIGRALALCEVIL
jgi:hypothetical protein